MASNYQQDSNVVDAFDIYMDASFRELGAGLYEQGQEGRSLKNCFQSLRISSDTARGLETRSSEVKTDQSFNPINPFWAD